ncbi:MAG: YigZ family protein [Bacteroidota bacterium]
MMEKADYKTVSGPSEGVYKEKGSKFIGLLYPLESETEVKKLIEPLRKAHPGACHFCYAYRLGFAGEQYRANDDGEPAGTAGKPILNQLLSAELTNVLLVVVRYFGGTKLGVSGLITAYKEAAIEAVNTAKIELKQVCDWYLIDFSYDQIGDINRLLKDRSAVLVDKNFDERCHYRIMVPIDRSAGFPGLFSGVENCVVSHLKRA